MECARCHGLMVQRGYCDREWRSVSRRWPRLPVMWNCLNCGNCLDKTIAFNRLEQREAMTCQRHEQIWETIKKQMQEVA